MTTILSRKNEKVQHFKRLGSDKKYRQACGEMLCDGEKLLHEALSHGYEITGVFAAGETVGISGCDEVYITTQDIIDFISPLKTAQKVIFSCKIKDKPRIFTGNSVILENVQDPGNVGAMLRCANAFEISCVYLLGSCADVYNPKTIRASMGAVFRQNFSVIDYEDVDAIKALGIPVYGTALSEDCVSIEKVLLSDCCFVIGNEGQGITDKLLSKCDKKVIIPMNPDCESLNAASAAAVIMWEMKKEK